LKPQALKKDVPKNNAAKETLTLREKKKTFFPPKIVTKEFPGLEER